MNSARFGELEVLAHAPGDSQNARATPLLLVHGAYSGAWCWDDNFLPYFADLGYTTYAVSLSGHGNSRGRNMLDNFSIEDYVSDLAEVVDTLPATPAMIGHSMGGMVVQKYLERADIPAAVLLCSVPPQGLMSSALGLMFSAPDVLSELNRMMTGGTPALDSLQKSLFYQPVEPTKLARCAALSQPESHRAIWDMTLFNLPQINAMQLPPMLVLGAEYDHLIPTAQVRATAATYRTEAHIFPDMGHGVMLERDWQVVAKHIADWLDEQVD